MFNEYFRFFSKCCRQGINFKCFEISLIIITILIQTTIFGWSERNKKVKLQFTGFNNLQYLILKRNLQ
jgi:hypothetical protein